MATDALGLDLPFAAASSVAHTVLEWLLDIRGLRRVYAAARASSAGEFERCLLSALDIDTDLRIADLNQIPPSGPVVVAANHPHGAVDGLVLAEAVRRVRPDVRILANHLLSRIPELADLCFFVDPFATAAAPATTRAGLRAAHMWLRRGGALIAFPAGEVAHRASTSGVRIDSPWKPTAIALASATGAQIVPAFITGGNSRLFYAAGRVHPLLRTLLLAREFLRLQGRRISVRIGSPMPAGTPTQEVRREADALRRTRAPRPRVSPIESEVASLHPSACLVESGSFQVFCARASQIPATLREIGRLRERTYRAIGEGTGGAIDVDRFDQEYLHLFSWDAARRRVVGAYRLGETDRLTATYGTDALYTRTLFRYDERLLARFGAPALELGRSFVRVEYQKNYSALLLLWKGLGQFIVRNPRYRVLFGPVSISRRYSDSSHRVLMGFLLRNHLQRDLAGLVRALNPSRIAPDVSTPIVKSIGEVDQLVAATDGHGVPVLLRQYLKLNARLLGFNVDPNFGNALDALMMVDLTCVEPATLSRYLGRSGAASFREWQVERAA